MDDENRTATGENKETRLTGKAYRFIKEAIVNYQLKPGAGLGLRSLAATLKMSQTPVREALIRLELEQFIQRRGKKGFIVASFTLDQVKELYDLRIVLETAGIRWAARRFDSRIRERMAENLAKTAALLDTASKSEILFREHRFHVVMLEVSGNEPLRRMGRVILDRVRLIQNLSLLTSGRLSQAHRQHGEIFRALESRESERAIALMVSHLQEAREHLVSRLNNEDDILSLLLSDMPGTGAEPLK